MDRSSLTLESVQFPQKIMCFFVWGAGGHLLCYGYWVKQVTRPIKPIGLHACSSWNALAPIRAQVYILTYRCPLE